MKDLNNENLEELLAKFYDAAEAKQAAQEILKAEQILRASPAAEPSEALIADIKSQIAMRLAQRRASARRLVLAKAVAVAAVFVILALVAVRFFNQSRPMERGHSPVPAMISQEVWESSDIAADDPDLATLSAQIEEVARNLLSVRLDEDGDGNGEAVVDIEVKLIEIESNFWKG